MSTFCGREGGKLVVDLSFFFKSCLANSWDHTKITKKFCSTVTGRPSKLNMGRMEATMPDTLGWSKMNSVIGKLGKYNDVFD